MKRILINATHAEETRVALCKDNYVYDFDLENRTREQKKANIYKGHITRVEPSLEAVFVEYGAERQGFLSIREISREYLSGDPKNCKNIKEVISEGTELLVQVEKEERGNKGAALSTYISLAGRYLVLMPNNASGGGISRQISGRTRDEMKRVLSKLALPKGMSVILRTAGIGRTQEDIQQDLNHLLEIWNSINHTAKTKKSPCLAHREAGVVTRAVRDYLRDDIAEVWIDNEQAYNEAYHFVEAVMPHQLKKLRKYLQIEPMFSNFGVEAQIESAYEREVKLPSGGSIVIDQTEALVSIDINSAKSTKGGDVETTAYHTNLEAADEIARQLRLRDMGGLVVIDFIDMLEEQHRKDVENRMKDATNNDRARIQFANISRFGLLEMSRQRLRPSLEEATGFVCPRCNGDGVIRDIRSLSISIIRKIEKIALKEGHGELQVEVPVEIGAFILNEKRDSLVYLEQDSGTRITILPHPHLEAPAFNIDFNRAGFAPATYTRINSVQDEQSKTRGYDTDWHTEEQSNPSQRSRTQKTRERANNKVHKNAKKTSANQQNQPAPTNNSACAWLDNLFTQPTQALTLEGIDNAAAAAAIEEQINSGARSLGVDGQVEIPRKNNKNNRRTNKDDKRKPRRDRDSADRNSRDKDNKETKNRNHSRKNENTPPKREDTARRPSRGERDRNKEVTIADAQEINENTSDKQSAKQHRSNGRSKSSQRHEKNDGNFVNVNIDKTPSDANVQQHINIDVETGNTTKTPVSFDIAKNDSSQSKLPIQEDSITDDTEEAVKAVVEKKIPANQLGRAKNDPRNSSEPKAVSGTMASFISTVLAEKAKETIENKGLIAAFLAALAQNSSHQELSPIVIDDTVINAYRASIAAEGHASAVAGTSAATAPTPAFRATNDTRGQIVGFEEVPSHLLISQTQEIAENPSVEENSTPTAQHNSDSSNTDDLNIGTTDDANEINVTSDSASIAEPLESTESNISDKIVTTQALDEKSAQILANAEASLKAMTAGAFIQTQLGAIGDNVTEDNFEQLFMQALNTVKPEDEVQTEAEPSVSPTEASTTASEGKTTEDNKKVRKTPVKRTRKKKEDVVEEASDTVEKKEKPKKKRTPTKRRTSKKATADKVTVITKKPTTSADETDVEVEVKEEASTDTSSISNNSEALNEPESTSANTEQVVSETASNEDIKNDD